MLTGIDLQTGERISLVSDTHTKKDPLEFLRILEEKYPKGDKIRFVLDNPMVHSSMEVKECLNTVPDRFEFVFTSKHESWPILVEGIFNKMTKQTLKKDTG